MTFANIDSTIPKEIRRGAWPGPIWINRIERTPCGGFIVDDTSDLLAIEFGVYSNGAGSELIDIGAVIANGDVMTLRGGCPMLGAEHYDFADWHQTRLRVFSHPLSYIKSGGKGVCPLDWMLAAPLLARIDSLTCCNRDHAAEIERRLEPWRQPPLYYMKAAA